jgi:glyoxalase-like protein
MATSTVIMLSAALAGVSGLLAMQDGAAVDIDHVILGVNNLERGMQAFESRTGVAPKRGGEHPGRGTQNALVALGDGRYLEILAPAATLQPDAALGESVSHAELTLVGWALRTPNIRRIVDRVRSAGFEVNGPLPGSRRTTDGALLAWQSANLGQLGVTPFFIEWSKDTPHPSTTSPSGCTLVNMELTQPTPDRLQLLFKTIAFRGPVLRGAHPGMQVTLACPRGRVEFRS